MTGGTVPMQPCPSGEHTFQPLSLATIASALGRQGGRPKTYGTEEERRAARLATFARSNARRKKVKS